MVNLEKQKENGKFLKITCPRCKYGKIIYGKASSRIKCEKCNKMLIKNTGGKTKIKAPVRRIL